jgi:hypothetical protein
VKPFHLDGPEHDTYQSGVDFINRRGTPYGELPKLAMARPGHDSPHAAGIAID